MSLQGEWWIDDTGYAQFADGDIGDQNHETIAFWAALGIDPEESFLSKYGFERALESVTEYLQKTGDEFSPDEILDSFLEALTPGYMTDAQAIGLLALGADSKAVNYFQKHNGDAREFMMAERAWIRVDDNNFQLWTLDDEALGRIRDFINNEYPEDEDPLEDEFQIEELREGGVHLSVFGADLLESGKSANALKYSARRERTGMYNPPNLDARHAALAAKAVAETITKAELREAQALVDEAAKAAGYNVGPVYHGTKKAFTVFDPETRGSNTYQKKDEVGFHFDTEERQAREYAGKKGYVLRVFLKQENPLRLETSTPRSELVQRAELAGHDGIDAPSGYGSNREYVVFNPSQIKSAETFTFDDDGYLIPLSERFQADSPDIRHNPDPSERTYYEIGHRGLKSKLWYGDEFNINVEPAEFDTDAKDVDPRNLHNEWALRMPWHGRYDPYSGEVSIMGGTMTEEWRQPSEQMLDRLRETFGADVQIVQFNPSSGNRERTGGHNPRRRGSLSIPVIHPGCDVQVIEDYRDAKGELHSRWKTIDTCFDTPKAIGDVFRKHGLQSAWIRDAIGGRRMVTMRELI
jgi:hypothetical protein